MLMRRFIPLLLALWPCLAFSDALGGPPSFAEPEFLSYADVVEMLESRPQGELAEKLRRQARTPLVSNGAWHQGVRPHAPHDEQIGTYLRAALWNIEHGLRLDDIKLLFTDAEALDERLRTQGAGERARKAALEEAALLRQADVLVLNEADWGVDRTGYLEVTAEIAAAAGMNFAFVPEFVELSPLLQPERAGRLEAERYRGLHGMAVLSRYRIVQARAVPFSVQPYDWYAGEKDGFSHLENGKRKLAAWAWQRKLQRELRLGGRTMLLVDIEVPQLPEGRVTVVATHLENRSHPRQRWLQMAELLQEIAPLRHPVIVAGDLNTSTRDHRPASVTGEVRSRVRSKGFWLNVGMKLATGMGVMADFSRTALGFARTQTDPTVRHLFFLGPNSERGLFRDLEEFRFDDGGAFDFRGDRERSANGKGGTLANSNQRASKGFKSTYRMPRTYGSVGEFKLDWLLVKGYAADPRDSAGSYRFAPHRGRTLAPLNRAPAGNLSDHDPLIVDLPLMEPRGE